VIQWRDLEERDRNEVVREFNDPIFARWLSGFAQPFLPCDFDDLLAELHARRADGKLIAGVATNEHGALLGAVSFQKQTAELGFWVVREHWGQGIGRRMVSEFVERFVTPSGAESIIAAVHSENIRSIRILKKCAFELMGEFHYHFSNDPDSRKAFFFRLLLGAARQLPRWKEGPSCV
jgi:[ribosomal protein S5]-alanine N-acetyltransferase